MEFYCSDCKYPLDFVETGIYRCMKCKREYMRLGSRTTMVRVRTIVTLSAKEKYL